LNQPFVQSAEKFITQKALQDTSVKLLEPGTLLMAMYGEGKTRGKCSELKIRATTNQACAAIALKPDHVKLRPWLKMTLAARYESNRRLSSGGVQPNLNLGLIKDMVVSIPPAEERSEILEQLEICRTAQLHLASELAEVQTRANVLRRALLVEAFGGRLVPQNSSDEPASVPRERISAEQTTSPKTRRARHTAKNTNPEQESML
jgi:type I restriction enzyme, S subunit